ncbi:MAG: hypothetical protein KAV87_06240 [Desulfobacteraceae bacterium]|nr:hypothetical protein [Desulfobacteraceae bacterium]
MDKTEIPCAYCGVLKAYPDEFPAIIYAKCRDCIDKECREREAKKWRNQFLAFLSKHSK